MRRGVDHPEPRRPVRLVAHVAGDGRAEADHLADRVAILDGGRLIAQGRPEELKARIPGGRIELRFADAGTLSAAAAAVGSPVPGGDDLTLQIPTDGNVATLRGVLRALDDADVDVVDLAVHTPDLDDVFLELTR